MSYFFKTWRGAALGRCLYKNLHPDLRGRVWTLLSGRISPYTHVFHIHTSVHVGIMYHPDSLKIKGSSWSDSRAVETYLWQQLQFVKNSDSVPVTSVAYGYPMSTSWNPVKGKLPGLDVWMQRHFRAPGSAFPKDQGSEGQLHAISQKRFRRKHDLNVGAVSHGIEPH